MLFRSKRKADERQQLEEKRKQYKSLDDTRDKFRKIAYSYQYIADDPENPNVRSGRDVMKTDVFFNDWVKVKNMYDTLPVEDVDWYYELKADMEQYLNSTKETSKETIKKAIEFINPINYIIFDE